MELNKLQLQQILREMGVPFDSETSRADLQRMLQQENHRRWVAQAKRGSVRRVIRRRRADGKKNVAHIDEAGRFGNAAGVH